MEKARSIPEGNKESQVEPPIPQSKLRQSTRPTRAPKRYSTSSLHYLLLIDSDEPECYEEALQVEAEDKWKLSMDDEIESFMKN